MKKSLFVITILIFLISCTKKPDYQIEIDNQVKNINTLEDKKQYLSNLFNKSQGIINEIEILEKKFLLNQVEIYKLRKKRDSLIPLNSYRVESYLKKFEYPSSDNFNENEKMAIYHTVFNDFREEEQLKYFNLFKNLYKDSVINKYNYLGYLSKVFYLKHASFFKFDKRHTIDEMIEDITPDIIKIKKAI